ncbi:valine--tRNA ligase [Candidatus Roizmanbacteria bacterium RIFCSPLOWO2_01_FULL_35_13]|uniref:Valine--tRNA ligase n=1 Tax=Candidatus Roizmanbacteria bacterium RIFCSPLOWO2_01_FULL_35_13 TaxID=1802055 RepID=A0A1F7IGX5_9BACT|nr:MAG: valine--tRNA ligase [Candidatus Roizmanbacteria bacterium RIFCSPLOWO2_01_FULL_35_13]
MDKKFIPSQAEENIYRFWEKEKLNRSEKGKPYTILMPPPNANASLHAGHGMYSVDDVLIRYKRLLGFASLWIPGTDHAGFETQFVYEKHLAKQDKSRMDFDRQTFYDNVYKFVQDNSGLIYQQFKKLGFLADWKRSIFTLDKHVLKRVFKTFEMMQKEGLIYRDDYLVNYCTYCGTSLAELEIEHVERIDPLYYMKYGPFVLATVRPETKFGDTALAVNPKDKRYKKWVGKMVEAEGLLGKFKIKVIADETVDPKFGTGVVKITPAHDFNDFETGKRHGLDIKQVVDIRGRLNKLAGPYEGLKVKQARQKVAEDMEKKGLMEKTDRDYLHSIAICYRCKRDLEPMIIPNWYIKVETLKPPVIQAVKKNKIRFYPGKFKKQLLLWMERMHDWPISRQIAWGIRIPAWYDVKTNPDIFVIFLDKTGKSNSGYIKDLLKNFDLKEIEEGLQKLAAPKKSKFVISEEKPVGNYLRETDTFDTWFSSGQWPLVTLKEKEYKERFPTDMMGTSKDILEMWVSRMIMFSLYIKKEVPFKNVYLWPMVTDSKGQKMSKSKGNVINPIDLVYKYGADAFRASLFFGTSSEGKINLGEEKIIGMRNFANKIWNIGRFIEMNRISNFQFPISKQTSNPNGRILKKLQKEFEEEKKQYIKSMDSFKFSQAFGQVYEFIWHRFADYYIEQLKEELKAGRIEVLEELQKVYFENLKMLHPFMPFVTEAVWMVFNQGKKSILEERL